MERKPPRLYIALANHIRIRQLENGFIFFLRDDKLFSTAISNLGNQTIITLPKIGAHETVELTLWRTPQSAVLEIVRKDLIVYLMEDRGLPWISDYSLELPTGYNFSGEKPIEGSSHNVLCFKKDGELELHIRKDLVRAIYDLPNSNWIWPCDSPSPP